MSQEDDLVQRLAELERIRPALANSGGPLYWEARRTWVPKFKEGDRVKWAGPYPEDPEPDDPIPGEEGTIVSEDPPYEYVVYWDTAGVAVFPEPLLAPVENAKQP